MATLYKRLLMLILALALWLIARPYRGIWHDGKFYALQALQHLNPTAFSRDLFFLYGSQDQYSLFSHIYAAAISGWGLNPGTMALQGVGLGLWFLAARSLTRVLPDRWGLLALLLMTIAACSYGSHGVFSYGESFLTARLYAETLSLAGVAAWLGKRTALGWLAFAGACVIHPLMALPAMMIGLGLLLRPRVWFGLMGVCALLALGLGLAGVQPFAGLVQPMDASWWHLAVARSPFVFLHAWEWEGFSRALFVVVVTFTAWRILPESDLRRLAWVTLTCVLGAFAITYVGGSLLWLPLIAGLQLTRVMWIGMVVTLMLIAAMLSAEREGTVWKRFLVWGLAMAVFIDARTQGVYALLVLGVFGLGCRHLPAYRPPVWLWLLLGAVPLQVVLWGALSMRVNGEWSALVGEEIVWRTYFTNPATALVFAASAYWVLVQDRLTVLLKSAGGIVAAGLLIVALVTWNDLQPELDYDSPARRAAIAPITALVPQNATVYWVEESDKAWFWLGRANYLSFSQTAGSVFSGGTAIEAIRRAPFVRAASLRDASQSWSERPSISPAGLLNKVAVRQACRDPILDYVIGRSEPGPDLLYFRDPETGWGYGLHNCRTARALGPPVSTANAVDKQGKVKRRL